MIVAVPAALPVTTPVVESIDATATLLDDHFPPETELANVVVMAVDKTLLPDMAVGIA